MNVLSPGQVDTPDSQRLDKETREMFESLIPAMADDSTLLLAQGQPNRRPFGRQARSAGLR